MGEQKASLNVQKAEINQKTGETGKNLKDQKLYTEVNVHYIHLNTL